MSRPLDDFTVEEFTADGKTSPVYVTGGGPAVIVIAEIPVSPAGRLVRPARGRSRLHGVRAVAVRRGRTRPGEAGAAGTFADTGRAVGSLLRKVCVSREFTILATGRTSPVVSWLRALAEAHERCGGPGVGAIGMYLTGGFALAMAVDDTMIAPVLSQPSLPLRVVGNARNIDISTTISHASSRAARPGCGSWARFDGDPMVPAERFSYLRDQLGDAFIGIELPGSSANPDALLPVPRSVVTEQLIDEPGEPTRGR